MTAVRPGSRRWDELRDGAMARDADRNWFLGDAALEIAPMGDDHTRTGVLDNLRRFAEETGVGFDVIRECRRVADAWPDANRLASTSWKVHSILASRPHLIREGMTVTQAHAAAGQSTTGRTGPQAGAKAKANAALDLLADPFVIAAMPPETRSRLADALDPTTPIIATGIEEGQRAQRRHEREEAAHEDPGSLYVAGMVAFAEIVDGVEQHRWTAERAIEVLTEGADRLTRMRDEMTTRKEFEEITGGT